MIRPHQSSYGRYGDGLIFYHGPNGENLSAHYVATSLLLAWATRIGLRKRWRQLNKYLARGGSLSGASAASWPAAAEVPMLQSLDS